MVIPFGYSNNVKIHQHDCSSDSTAKKIETDYPAKTFNIDSLEKIVFVSPFFQSGLIELFEIPMHFENTPLYPNYVQWKKASLTISR